MVGKPRNLDARPNGHEWPWTSKDASLSQRNGPFLGIQAALRQAASDGSWDWRPLRGVFTDARDPPAMRHSRMAVQPLGN